MLIGALSIFLAFNLDLSFHSSFVSYRQNYTRTWFIFISAYKCYRFNYHHLSRLFILVSSFTPMLIRTRKAVRLLKEGKQQKKEKHPCSSLFGAICLICGYALAANPLYFMSLGDIIDFYMPSLVYLSSHRLLRLEHTFSFHKLVFTYSYFKTRRKFYMKRINML